MATLVLTTLAGYAFGSGTLAAALGTAAASVAGYMIDQRLFGRDMEGQRLAPMRPTIAEEGAPLPRIYGTARVSGVLIWATRHEEVRTSKRRGAKGGPKLTEYSYFGNFAMAVAQGEISHIRRIWADGKEYDQTRAAIRVYRGSERQLPDPLIEAKQGADNAPAYRGTAYVVFDRIPLDEFGGRIPQFQFEVIRAVGDVAQGLTAVALIPGATEFGLSPRAVVDEPSKGETRSLNRASLCAATDWQASMDELQALSPNLRHVAIIVPWFGNDLRAGECRIRPAVMDRHGHGESMEWKAGGVGRGQAHLLSRINGSAVYGGTPSDASIIGAIRDAAARGLSVTLYPFIMLDVPADNALPDPHGGARQPVNPWRGRITCHPAPYRPGSSNRTDAAAGQVSAFLGTAEAGAFRVEDDGVTFRGGSADWGYRRFVLHLAYLAQCAGGVEAFLLGSELRGLTMIRDAAGDFPFVKGLCRLAGEVRAILGPACKLTYGADWSEYFGHHPQDGSGDVFYNLDALWAHPAIDAVGIDNYMPLSDWRDEDHGSANPDGFAAPYDLEALSGQIEAGEGFDWYYASTGDRQARRRTPIGDGEGRGWVYRFKDMASWWSRPHMNRISGIESRSPWQPRSKMIWFTELGCPAVDKGPNQPNVFPDAVSSEGSLPWHSDATRSDLAQNRYLRAHLTYHYRDMVDRERIYVWAWDTRPFPEFPLNRSLWADGNNWMTGHWLNGRLSGAALDELLGAILSDFGIRNFDTQGADGFVGGYVIDGPSSVRAALEPLLQLHGVNAFESAGDLVFRSESRTARRITLLNEFVEEDDDSGPSRRIEEMFDQPARVEIGYRDPMLDYQTCLAFAERQDGRGINSLSVPAMLEPAAARMLAEEWMQRRRAGRHSARFAVPWKQARLRVGDKVRLAGSVVPRDYVVTSIEDGAARRIEARALPQHVRHAVHAALPAVTARSSTGMRGRPFYRMADLPMWPGVEDSAGQFRIAALARPWGGADIFASPTGTGFELRSRLDLCATMGELTAPLPPGTSGRMLPGMEARVRLFHGELASVSSAHLFNGANTALLGTADGGWELFQFLAAEEVAPDEWLLKGLLRGQCGTENEAAQARDAGATFILLDDAVAPAGLKGREKGLAINWRVGASGEVFSDQYYATEAATGGMRALLPLAPVHLRAMAEPNGDLRLTWVRRGRLDADDWIAADIPLGEAGEAYRIEVGLGGIATRVEEVAAAHWLYPAGSRRADLGSLTAPFEISIAMISAAVGPGIALRRRLVPGNNGLISII